MYFGADIKPNIIKKIYSQGSRFFRPIEAYLGQVSDDSTDIGFEFNTVKKIIDSVKEFYNFKFVQKDTNRNIIWLHFKTSPNDYESLVEFAEWLEKKKKTSSEKRIASNISAFEFNLDYSVNSTMCGYINIIDLK